VSARTARQNADAAAEVRDPLGMSPLAGAWLLGTSVMARPKALEILTKFSRARSGERFSLNYVATSGG
jgi:hypothetical protein